MQQRTSKLNLTCSMFGITFHSFSLTKENMLNILTIYIIFPHLLSETLVSLVKPPRRAILHHCDTSVAQTLHNLKCTHNNKNLIYVLFLCNVQVILQLFTSCCLIQILFHCLLYEELKRCFLPNLKILLRKYLYCEPI